MKTSLLPSLCLIVGALTTGAATPEPEGVRKVGVYDSRAVAFAHFWSPPARQARDALLAEASAAKAAGEEARLTELTERIKAEQERVHLQVFSTAPATEAMAALRDRLPAIQRELGVDRLVSKWDEAALRDVPAAERIDATDRLAAEFQPDDVRRRTIEQMKTKKPLPLTVAKLLAKAGKL